MHTLRRQLLIFAVRNEPITHTLDIITDDAYVGKTFYCISECDGDRVFGEWSIVSGYEYASINENGRVDIVPGTVAQSITIMCAYEVGGATISATKNITVSYDNQLTIECASEITGTTGNAVALYNDEIVAPSWCLLSGSQYAQINSDGIITIASSGDITIQAVYNEHTKTKDVSVTYAANTASTTEVGQDGSVTVTTTVTTQNPDGSITETSSSTTTENDGFIVTSESETTTSQDGSSISSTTTTNQDGTSSQSTTNVAADGSSTSTTTNYNADGDPTSATNNDIDTSGNSSTQTLVYDNSGNATVTGYTIDTSGSEDGSKNFNADGVNTGYYAFDMTHGFILDFDFAIDFANQPANQDGNIHQILAMKRNSPKPWYGFQLRQQNGATNNIIIGTQFTNGSNTNTNIQPMSITGNMSEYNLKIIYVPTAATNKFQCINKNTDAVIFSNNDTFPDLPELRYLKMTIGYAQDENGNPYRYSNIGVKNFSIRRLTNVADPVITCDGLFVTITCGTADATIYYRFNETGRFAAYSSPIPITADTFVEAYAVLDTDTGNTVSATCVYSGSV